MRQFELLPLVICYEIWYNEHINFCPCRELGIAFLGFFLYNSKL